MDLRQLRYFLAVADAGHITRAAAQLGLQQPPLSQQIKALEARLQLTLFERHPKGVTLTEAGRLLQVEARQLVAQADALQRRMGQVAVGLQGPLRLGFTSSAAAHAFVPQVLRECRRQYPGIRLELAEFNAAELTEQVAALPTVPVTKKPEGSGVVETYSVHYDWPVRTGIIVGRLDADGSRFMATTTDEELVALMSDGDPLGANISVTATDDGNRAVLR